MANVSRAKTKRTERKKHHEEERVSEGKVSISDDRREDRGAGRLAGQDALPAPHIDQASRPRSRRGVEVERGSSVVSRRIDLHRRDVQDVVKMTFAKGAALKDPSGLFNSSLDGNTRRAIDLHEGEKIDEEALKALIRAAVTLNVSRAHG
jgi:Domain of unknown function (DU1801)